MAEVPFRPVRQLSEYKGKGASVSRERDYQMVFLSCDLSAKVKTGRRRTSCSLLTLVAASFTELAVYDCFILSLFFINELVNLKRAGARAAVSMRQTEALASVIFFVSSVIFSFNTLNT